MLYACVTCATFRYVMRANDPLVQLQKREKNTKYFVVSQKKRINIYCPVYFFLEQITKNPFNFFISPLFHFDSPF